MEIFKKLMLLIGTLAVAMLPFGFSLGKNMNQTWVDLFGRGEALLLGVVFAADVLRRCFVQTKDRPSRLIIGLLAGVICLAELAFYGYASSKGQFNVWRRTVAKRRAAKLKQLQTMLYQRMHQPVAQVGMWLKRVVNGYYQYHAVPGNTRALHRFRRRLSRLWLQALRRRSQKRRMNWTRFQLLCACWLPSPRVLHPYPVIRFYATHPR
jgi:hypothetical protein